MSATIDGQPLTTSQAWNVLHDAAQLVGIRWNDSSCDCALRLVIASVAVNTVRDLLSHADIKTTLRYAHPSRDVRATAVEMLYLSPTNITQDAYHRHAA